ncbi:hypothetical protein [Mesorhizobium sp. LNJC405B00]|nr:hypothetical protein [Mesorhizobium sp. LNJC405B00]
MVNAEGVGHASVEVDRHEEGQGSSRLQNRIRLHYIWADGTSF